MARQVRPTRSDLCRVATTTNTTLRKGENDGNDRAAMGHARSVRRGSDVLWKDQVTAMLLLPMFDDEDAVTSAQWAAESVGQGPLDTYFRDISVHADEWVSMEDNYSVSRVTLTDDDRLALALLDMIATTRTRVGWPGEWEYEDIRGTFNYFQHWAAFTVAHVRVDNAGFADADVFSDEDTEQAAWTRVGEQVSQDNACDCEHCAAMEDAVPGHHAEHYCAWDDCECARIARDRRNRGDYPGGLADEVRQAETWGGTT